MKLGKNEELHVILLDMSVILTAATMNLVELLVILRPTVGWSVFLGDGQPNVAYDQIFIIVGHLYFSCYGAPSLMRGQG
jgi:hypothetical protein